MRVEMTSIGGILKLRFCPERDEPLTDKLKMGNRVCQVILPPDWSTDNIHPDLLALSIVLMIYPFAGQEINLPFGVSQPLHEGFLKLTKKKLQPVDPTLIPRSIPAKGIPALAFSGGVDSTAALMVLPEDTILIFLDRIQNPGVATLYNKDAAHFACERMKKEGRNVYMVASDLEYVKNPVGVPVDVANAVPALLLADYLSLDSIAFGTCMESAYQIGHIAFQDYQKRLHFRRWGGLFERVGLPFNQVTAGMSEVATTKIVLQSPYKNMAQSCMRGTAGNPCMNCYKCFRKKLAEAVLSHIKLDDEYLNSAFLNKHLPRYLSREPIWHENVLAYVSSQYQGKHVLMNLLRKKTRGDRLETKWMEKWYGPSIELLPVKYRDHVKSRILALLEQMNETDQSQAEAWNLIDSINSDEYKACSQKILEELLLLVKEG